MAKKKTIAPKKKASNKMLTPMSSDAKRFSRHILQL